MNNVFKPLGLAAAVAAVTAGYAGVASAQAPTARSVGNLGDLAIIPYYTVQDNWITGVHIINSSDMTQVVKLRLRRAKDSMDALDFNLILSPKDEWTGFLDDSSGNIVFATDDNSCTAPLRADGRFEMPAIYRTGAEEGYIEVISMGAAYDEDLPIAVGAKHDSDGEPFDCVSVASNFFKNASCDWTKKGVCDSDETYQAVSDASDYDRSGYDVEFECTSDDGPAVCYNEYRDGGNALKVSYFFRDAAAGTEMGGNAVHIEDFSDWAWMSNQETGLFSGDLTGFDYPDLNGGVLGFGDTRGMYNVLRQASILGVDTVLNDWSTNPALNVQTDWVVTMPGQYTMLDYRIFLAAQLNPVNCGKLDDPTTAIDDGVPLCDFRDIPVKATVTVYDREEGEKSIEEGDLVISPAPPGSTPTIQFPNEVNVVEWGNGEPVLESAYTVSGIDPVGIYGWAALSLESGKKLSTGGTVGTDVNSNGQAVCEFVFTPSDNPAVGVWASPSNAMRTGPVNFPTTINGRVCSAASGNVPIVGFVAWQRSFPANPDANYGRLIEHSFTSYSLSKQ